MFDFICLSISWTPLFKLDTLILLHYYSMQDCSKDKKCVILHLSRPTSDWIAIQETSVNAASGQVLSGVDTTCSMELFVLQYLDMK